MIQTLLSEHKSVHTSRHSMCTSQLQLPQQVALTGFKRQVSAKVKVIIVTQVKTLFPQE